MGASNSSQSNKLQFWEDRNLPVERRDAKAAIRKRDWLPFVTNNEEKFPTQQLTYNGKGDYTQTAPANMTPEEATAFIHHQNLRNLVSKTNKAPDGSPGIRIPTAPTQYLSIAPIRAEDIQKTLTTGKMPDLPQEQVDTMAIPVNFQPPNAVTQVPAIKMPNLDKMGVLKGEPGYHWNLIMDGPGAVGNFPPKIQENLSKFSGLSMALKSIFPSVYPPTTPEGRSLPITDIRSDQAKQLFFRIAMSALLRVRAEPARKEFDKCEAFVREHDGNNEVVNATCYGPLNQQLNEFRHGQSRVHEYCNKHAQLLEKNIYEGGVSWHEPWDQLVKCFNVENME